MVRQLALVMVGGALGSGARWLVSVGASRFWPDVAALPASTWIVNMLGCLAIGYAAAWTERAALQPEYYLFVGTGILGGFTTFSSFALQSLNLMSNGQAWAGWLNVGSQVFLGLAAASFGKFLAEF